MISERPASSASETFASGCERSDGRPCRSNKIAWKTFSDKQRRNAVLPQ